MSENWGIALSEIGAWSEAKLEIIRAYAEPYSVILKNQHGLSHAYIDAFAGAGIHISRTTGKFVPGSPLNALKVSPPFDDYYFIDIDRKKVDVLREAVGERPNVHIFEGDSNPILNDVIFPRMQRQHRRRALCLLDPYGLHVDWRVIQRAGKMGTIEIFLNFPTLDINRNVLWTDPLKASTWQQNRLTRFWGDESWHEVAYRTHELYGKKYEVKTSNSLLKRFAICLGR